MTADWAAAIAQWVAVAIGGIGVVVAWKQLTNLVAALKMNGLMAVLQLEAEMNARKERLNQTATEIRKEGSKDESNKELIVILNDEMEGYVENVLNSADRLAFCIAKGYLPEKDWRVEYRENFTDLVDKHSKYFGQTTIYTNLLDLVNKWRRE